MPTPTLRRSLARVRADLEGMEGGGVVVLTCPMDQTPLERRAWRAEHVRPIAKAGRMIVVVRKLGEA